MNEKRKSKKIEKMKENIKSHPQKKILKKEKNIYSPPERI